MKWTLLILTFLLVLPTLAFAQEDSPAEEQGDVRVTKAPKLIKEIKAEYTQDAIDNRVEGKVIMRLTIDANGDVTKVEPIQGLGYGLDEAATTAIQQFKFEPAEINGQPSAVVLNFAVQFSLPILPAAFDGRVIDKESGAGVPATVTISYVGDEYDPKPTATLTTEVDGSFGFADVPPGNYDVVLQIEGYDDYKTTIELINGQTSEAVYQVAASPINVLGKIRESGTRKAAVAFNVKMIAQVGGAVIRDEYTDAEGQFQFRGVKPGKYTLRFAAEGFFTSTAEVEVIKGQRTEATFYVESEYYNEYSITTRAKKAKTEVNQQRLELEEIRRIPGTFGDVVRVVQNLPGVARAPFVSGLIVVRGSAPQDTKVFLEGDSIPLVYHFFGGPAVINSEMIDAIEFYPGNFSTYYGRATAGVIDISTRSPKTDRFHGMIEVDILDTTAMLEGPITEDLSFGISGRRSYIDVVLPLVIPDDSVDLFVAPRYYDYQFWLTYKGIEDHKLELFIYGSDDAVALILPEGEPSGNADVQVTGIDLRNSFLRGQLRWEYTPDLPIENTLMMSYGVNDVSFEAAENLNFESQFISSQIREDLRIKLSKEFALRVGADLLYGLNEYSIVTPRFSDASDSSNSQGGGRPNFSADGLIATDSIPSLQPAVYGELEIRPFKNLLIIPGVRLDHYGEIGESSVSPRFSFRWDLEKEWTVKGGVGLFTQPALPSATDPNFGNPNLTYEKAMHYALGGEYRPLEYIEIDTTLFYRDMSDLIANTDDFVINDQGVTTPLLYSNEGEGRAYGLELLLRHQPQNRFFGWIAYTLSRSERLDLDTNEMVPYQYDQTHILTLVGGYNLPYGFDLSARFRLTTGSPATPVVDSVLDIENDKYNPIYGERNSIRAATFHQLDVRIDKKFVFDTWILGFYLDVINAYYAKTEEGVRYNYDFSESAPITGLPILPTFGINAQF